MDWIWLIVALLVGLAVGGIVAWTVVKRRYGDRESVVELRREHDRYKGKVTEHFVETAELVNTLTRNYKRVYDHLESGAYELVGEDTLRRELDAPAEAPVMLEYLGQRRSDALAEPEARAPEPEHAVAPGAPEGPGPEHSKPPRRRTPSATAATPSGDRDGKPGKPHPKEHRAHADDTGVDDTDVDPTDVDHTDVDHTDAKDRTRPNG